MLELADLSETFQTASHHDLPWRTYSNESPLFPRVPQTVDDVLQSDLHILAWSLCSCCVVVLAVSPHPDGVQVVRFFLHPRTVDKTPGIPECTPSNENTKSWSAKLSVEYMLCMTFIALHLNRSASGKRDVCANCLFDITLHKLVRQCIDVDVRLNSPLARFFFA